MTTLSRLDRRALLRLALAHHPTCLLFREDTFRIGGVPVCAGCLVAYPTLVATALALWWTGAVAPWWTWFALGWVFGSVQFVSVAGLARRRVAKVIVKACLGLGLSATFYGVILAPWPLAYKLAFTVFGMVLGAVALIPKAKRMIATCDGCMHQRDWDHCPGVGLIARVAPTRS